MKTLFRKMFNLFGSLTSILTFGVIKVNDNINKSYRVELLRVKLADLKLEERKSYDKLVKLEGDKRVVRKDINKLTSELNEIKKNLQNARDKKDLSLFTDLSNDYKDKEMLLKDKNDIIGTYNEATDLLENESKSIKNHIKRLNRTIAKIEAKQATYETIKNVNEVIGSMKKQTSDNISLDDMVEDLDNDMIRETTKAEMIRKDMVVDEVETIEFKNEAEMDEFLNSIK